MLQDVQIGPLSLDRFGAVLGTSNVEQARAAGEALRARLNGRVIWNVNTTAVGGGVAEMLQSLLCYARGVGVDVRWTVIGAEPEFYRITKRIHHALHGETGDGTALDEAARATYEATIEKNSAELTERVCPNDVVILHDPQTAGLAPALLKRGAIVIWRCHIGHDVTNGEVEAGWAFISRYLDDVPSLVFSRRAYCPESLARDRLTVIQPSIDAFSPKNQDLDETTIRAILAQTGLVDAPPPSTPRFTRGDGTPGRVERHADVTREGAAPPDDAPLIVQVSRWDPLKDMAGVMEGFVGAADRPELEAAHLVLAGPNVKGVQDDPEGPETFAAVVERWRALPAAHRARVHLACLPTDDVAENAVIVNALQRHARIVVQKSLHEGFGLTVTEAMWKGRPVVASAVGGIQDQIEDGVSGVLLDNPRDLDAFAAAVTELLADTARAERIGKAAKDRVREHFLGIRHLLAYVDLIGKLDC